LKAVISDLKPDTKLTKLNYKVKFVPFNTYVDVPAGTTILEAIRKAKLPLKASCGSNGTCGECIVQILEGTFTHKTTASLTADLLAQRYVLACLVEIQDDLIVQLPEFQELSLKTVTDSQFSSNRPNDISAIFEINPPIKQIDLQIPIPTLDDNYSDFKRLQQSLESKLGSANLPGQHLVCEYSVLKKLAATIRENSGQVTVILFSTENYQTILDIKPAFSKKGIYGINCDIGTTTVTLNLVDLESGKIVQTTTSYNQQLKCGEDIIARINYAQKTGRLQELHELIVLTLNRLIETAINNQPDGSPQVSYSDIYYCSISGNTTMLHLLLNLEPRYIREAPYVPTLNQVPFFRSQDLNLKLNDEAKIFCAPAVGSYVGGDITAGLLCTPILRDNHKISLFIDIGTNGELVIGNQDWLVTCACSAGPAFEGSSISCGTPATIGAIERLRIINNRLEYQVIGGGKPKGLCGSALIDLLAELFFYGFIDRFGKFNPQIAGEHLIEAATGRGFLIETGENSYWGKDLILTENDITNLIRTKAAIFSAYSLLMKNLGLTFDQIHKFYIAGGFGQHLKIENAIRIGLFPDLDREKFQYLGNSSLSGSYLILLSEHNRLLVNDLADKMTYLELNTESNYMNEYTGALFLPHTDINLFPSVKQICK